MAWSDTASQGQINFINGLVRERDASDEAKRRIAALIANGMDKRKAHDVIDYLKSLPKLAKAQDAAQPQQQIKVPAGRYALEREGRIDFFQVDTPEDGRWAGYVFVKQLFGAPGNFRRQPIKVREQRNAILEAIAVDPMAAAQRFGHELGICSQCGSPLTNEESIQLGIGPVCRAKLGDKLQPVTVAPAPAPAASVAQVRKAAAPVTEGLPTTFSELVARAKS